MLLNPVLKLEIPYQTGVREGENLSPVLSSLFYNDLVQFMSTKFQGLETISRCTIEHISDDVEVYLHLFVPLYADDTVILAEYHVDLQDTLNAMLDYCNRGLQVS